MTSTELVLHRGAREISRAELDTIDAPEATNTWFPIRHATVLDTVANRLESAGMTVRSTQLAVNDLGDVVGARFFSILDLAVPVAGDRGVSLSVGIRNSIDRSLPFGFCAGSRVFVCDNLSFNADLVVRRKHTTNGLVRFEEAVSQAVGQLASFRDGEEHRIGQLVGRTVTDFEAESTILRAYQDHEIISPQTIPTVLKEWREPSHAEFEPRTAWSLFNAFTEALKPTYTGNPQKFALRTMKLYQLLLPGAALEN